MTKARKDQRQPAEDRNPAEHRELRLSKETVRDLDPKARGVDVKGGVPKTKEG
jgi:hypothetical protein